MRSDVFRAVGGYDESHGFNEDIDLGLRLAERGVILSMVRKRYTCGPCVVSDGKVK